MFGGNLEAMTFASEIRAKCVEADLEQIVSFTIYDHAQKTTPKYTLCNAVKGINRKIGYGQPIQFTLQCPKKLNIMKL